MKNAEDELDSRIERYLKGQLTETEKQAFEERAKHDPLLTKEINDHKSALFLVKVKAVADWKARLNNYSSPNEKVSRTLFHHWYSWAAAAIILIPIVFLIYTNTRTNTKELFVTYFKPASAERQILRGNNIATETTKAFLEYNKGNYAEAFKTFENLINKNPTDELLFYAGVAALAANMPSKAQFYLAKLLNDKETLYQWRGKWYLSLAYLKENKIDETKVILTQLCDQPNSYNQRANELLNKLK